MKTNYKNLDANLSYNQILKAVGVSYFGGVSTSHKLELSEKAGVLTYGLYLAPWDLSGRNTCAGGAHCHEFCLNGSGQNKIDELARGREHSKINLSRIKKRAYFTKIGRYSCAQLYTKSEKRKRRRIVSACRLQCV